MTQAKPKMTFSSPEFAKAAESLGTRSANLNTASQRSSTPGVSDLSKSYTEAGRTTAQTINNDPIFQRLNYQDSRNFTEDSRRFDAILAAKKGAISGEQDTLRYQTDKNLEGNKYNSDAQVKSTGINADAAKYGADRGLEGNKYNADAGVRSTQIGADAQVKSTGLNADAAKYSADKGLAGTALMANASRYNALLGAGASLTSQQYRPLQFGR